MCFSKNHPGDFDRVDMAVGEFFAFHYIIGKTLSAADDGLIFPSKPDNPYENHVVDINLGNPVYDIGCSRIPSSKKVAKGIPSAGRFITGGKFFF